MKDIMVHGQNGALSSPFWFVLQGAIVGVIIGYFANWCGGGGAETLEERP